MASRHTLDLTVVPAFLLGSFLLSAWVIPLCGDEAYYWLWSVRPEWGYCDHPPAVAWLGHSLQLLSSHMAFFRLPGWLAYLGSVLLIARLAAHLAEPFFDDEARRHQVYRWTLAIAVVSPLLAHYATEMGPDSPLILAWSLGCWGLYQATHGRPRGWLCAGAALTLAVYSKLSGWMLAACMLGYLLQRPERRRHLATPAPWGGVALALVLLVPHILWNIQHDGQNYFFQWQLRSKHIAWTTANLLKPLEMLTDQGFLSFFSIAALAWALRRHNRNLAERDALELLMWFALPLQAFFLVFRVLGVGRWNWPLPSYLPISALLALFLVERRLEGSRWLRAAFWATSLWTLGALGLRAFPQMQTVTAEALEPASGQVTLRSNSLALAYPEVGRRMAEASAQRGVFLINDDYTEAAALTYYSGNFVRVVAPYREGSQFLVWNNYEQLLGRDGLLVCHRPLEKMPHVLHALQSSFESYKRLPTWEIGPLKFYPVECRKLIRPLLQKDPLAGR